MQEILTKNQTALLDKIKSNKFIIDNFYLTGGTALAAFYLKHRYSEDLDFFSEEEFDTINLDIFFSQIKKDLNIAKIDFQQSYNRNLFFLHFSDEILKTEFTFFPFPRIETGENKGGIVLDSLLDIAVNKLFTIYQRTKARDYVDLYFICREEGFLIDDLIAKARVKFDFHIDPIQLGTQFMKAVETEDMPRMIEGITHQIWQEFFKQEAGKLRKDILAS